MKKKAAGSATPPTVASDADAPAETSARTGADVVLIHGPTDDGAGLHVLRMKEAERSIEAGEVRPLKEGQPIHGEVVKLKPRDGAPMLCDVETTLEAPAPRRAPRSGPAQVASDRYRRNWDAIWKRRKASDVN